VTTTSRTTAAARRLRPFALALALAAGAAAPAAAAPPNLDQALEANAPRILKFLRQASGGQPCNVGVLKFLVQKGDGPASDNAGSLNLSIADRLEVALILALKEDDEDSIRILHNASAAVARANNPGNPRTEAGRRAFFRPIYTPAWGTEDKVDANVLLTGLVRLEKDLLSMHVKVQAIDSKGGQRDVVEFTAGTDPRALTESGESYVLTRAQTSGKKGTVTARGPDFSQLMVQATQKSLDLKKHKEAPVPVKELPIEFDILYDGEPVHVEKGTVPEPRQGQKVTFRLRHKNQDDVTYGVVLKINGKNTIFPGEEEKNDLNCYKWILAPKDSARVTGFQKTLGSATQFVVASAAESKRDEVNYGEHAGTFTLVVFRAKDRDEGPVEALAQAGKDKNLAAISRGTGPEVRPGTLAALQAQLRTPHSRHKPGQRGLVIGGDEVQKKVTQVDFTPYEFPVGVVNIRYYKPQGK
jgi:hypothetical protein